MNEEKAKRLVKALALFGQSSHANRFGDHWVVMVDDRIQLKTCPNCGVTIDD